MYVDLGASHKISSVVVKWGAAYPRDYMIQVSNDPAVWGSASTVFTRQGWTGGTDTITGLNATGRYVRVYELTQGNGSGASIAEFQAYGN